MVMAIRVVEFSNGGYKIWKIFAKKSTYQKEITAEFRFKKDFDVTKILNQDSFLFQRRENP